MKTLLNMAVVFVATTGTALAQTRGNTHASPPAVHASYPRWAAHPQAHARWRGYRPAWLVLHKSFDYDGPDYYYASPSPEGMSYGQAAMADSAGRYNYLSSLADMNELQRQRLANENERQHAEDRLRLRKMQAELREVEKQKRMDLIQEQNAAGPRAAPSVNVVSPISDAIDWPTWLQNENYSHYRAQVTQLFQQKARTGQVPAADRQQIEQMTAEILAELKTDIRNIRPQDYVAVKRFARALLAELQDPPSPNDRPNAGGLMAQVKPAGE